MSWAERSTAAGVFVANRLDTQAALDAYIVTDATEDHVSIDSSIHVSDTTASLKMAVLNEDGPASGSISVSFGTSLGEGDVVWFSYRVSAPYQFCYQPWSAGGTPAHKLSILSRDFRGASPIGSNQNNEAVVQVNENSGLFVGYHQDGVGFQSEDVAASTNCSGSDFKWQSCIDGDNEIIAGITYPLTGNNPETGAAWSACAQDRRQFGGLYSAKTESTYPFMRGYGDPLTGGLRQRPDEWITVTGMVQVGTWGSANSRWTLFAAYDGEKYHRLFDNTTCTLGGGGSPDYNGLTLLPYVSQRSAGGRHLSSQGSEIGGVTVLNLGVGTHLGNGTLEYVQSTGAFRFKTAADNYGTARFFHAASGINIINMASSSHGVATTTNGSVTLPQGTITLTSTTGFPTSGTVVIGEPDTSSGGGGPSHGNGEQHVQYTGVSGNNLTGCTGGTGVHDSGSPAVISSYIQLRLDNAASLPGSGTTESTVGVADDRPDTYIHYQDVIVSTQPINAPGGFEPPITALQILARSMAIGDFEQMPGVTGMDLFVGGPTAGIKTGYTDKFARDPANKIMYWSGSDHGEGGYFCKYDEEANAWTSLTQPPWMAYTGTPFHGYEHVIYDDTHAQLYIRQQNASNIKKWVSGSTWTDIDFSGTVSYAPAPVPICWFPDIGANGRIIIFQINGTILLGIVFGIDPITLDVDVYANGEELSPIGQLHNFCQYSPTHQCVIFGSGNDAVAGTSREIWRLDPDGTVTHLTDIPGALDQLGPNGDPSLLVYNPGTGNFLAIRSPSVWYDFDPTGSGTWTAKGGTASPWNSNVFDGSMPLFGTTAVPIPEYGIIVFVKGFSSSSDAEMWVYKVAEETGSEGGGEPGGGVELLMRLHSEGLFAGA